MLFKKNLKTGIFLVFFFSQACSLVPHQPQRPSPPAGKSAAAIQKPVDTARTTPLMMPRPPQPEQLPRQTEALPPGSPVSDSGQSSHPVVVSLLDSASRYERQGELGRAAASIERGLRIAPKDAHLWLRLARIRLQQERPQQAELLAKKSIRFALGQAGLLADNWLLIAAARGRQGDLNGVVEAKEKAAQYQSY